MIFVQVRAVVPADQQVLEHPACAVDVGGVGPVDGLEVLLSGDPTDAGVLVGAVGVGREAFVVERRADGVDGAVGHEVAEQAAGAGADQVFHWPTA
jgi:hypothetical protein